MDLLFFDLDGTLLDSESEISNFTQEILVKLKLNNIAYSAATGRTMLTGTDILKGHGFHLPQVYSNGVTIWDPRNNSLSLEHLLGSSEISIIIEAAGLQGITPFVHAVSESEYSIYHAKPRHDIEKELISARYQNTEAKIMSLDQLTDMSQVTNVSMIGIAAAVEEVQRELNKNRNLVSYSGPAMEGSPYKWMDIHHCKASKGAAVKKIKDILGATNLICFGDSDNDLSMFRISDESYAPANAKGKLKEVANDVIGTNDKDGVAHFLKERFAL